GRIDVLVNNAGIAMEGILPTMRMRDIVEVIEVNLTAALVLAQACSRFMLRQGAGCIVNVSSVHAIRGRAGVAVYHATKAALDGLTRSLARELGPRQIRVNSVAPGYFESDMVGNLPDAEKKRIARRTPLGRLARVDEIANAVHFLTSDQASFITGQTLVVDAGITCCPRRPSAKSNPLCPSVSARSWQSAPAKSAICPVTKSSAQRSASARSTWRCWWPNWKRSSAWIRLPSWFRLPASDRWTISCEPISR